MVSKTGILGSAGGYVTGVLRSVRRNIALRRSAFFRRYPYRGSIPLRIANNRGLIDTGRKFFYNDIPKAASSTITVTLAQTFFGKEFAGRSEAKSMFKTPAEMTAQNMRDFPHFFKFTFVRDPYSSVLSAYLDKGSDPAYLSKKLPRSWLTRSFEKRGRLPTFKEFLQYLERGGLHEDGHWAPQTSLMLIPLSEFDVVGRFENFGSDFRRILALIDPTGSTSTIFSSRPHATGADEKLAQYYDDQARDTVARLYKDDFEALGYERY